MNELTSFGNLFKQMWVQKSKYIYLLFVINLFTIAFLSIFAWGTGNYDLTFFYTPTHNLGSFWRYNMATLTIYFDIAFCAVTCWQNEKINMSQTWHLAAVDERKTYLANVFSSLIACGVFFLLQQVINILLLIPIWDQIVWQKHLVNLAYLLLHQMCQESMYLLNSIGYL